MCFLMIKNELKTSKKYLLDIKAFKGDIERIFVNAKTYNANQTEIYQTAIRIHEKATQMMNNEKLKETVESFSKATIDEGNFSLYMRQLYSEKERSDQVVHKPKLSVTKPRDLMLSLDMPNIRFFGIKTQAVIEGPSNILEITAQNSQDIDIESKNQAAI